MNPLRLTAMFAIAAVLTAAWTAGAGATTNGQAMRTPAEILKVMEQSDIEYKVSTVAKVERTELGAGGGAAPGISPWARVKYAQDGTASVVVEEPKGEILSIFEQAAEKLKKKEYKEVADLYEQALARDPNYFKTVTNLGDTYYLRGEMDQAEKYLKEAVRLNEGGYQERLFLADTYHKSGLKDKALEQITVAYMLNRNNAVVQQSLRRILKENNLRVRPDRFRFPFRIVVSSPTKCEMMYEGKDALAWMGMANCLACWQAEPLLKKRIDDKEGGFDARVDMYREAISNQILATAARMEGKEVISRQEQAIYDAAKEGFVDAMVFWEVLANERPAVILLLSRDAKARTCDYIKKYVYEPEDQATEAGAAAKGM
jgi:hypothetical protein